MIHPSPSPAVAAPRGPRPRPSRVRVFDPQSMSAAARARVAEQLYPVYKGLFQLGDFEFFLHHLLFPEGELVRTGVFYDAADRAVGFVNVYIREACAAGRRIAVMRGSVFADLDHDCSAAVVPVCLRFLLRYRLQHPLVPLFVFGITVSRAAYVFFNRYVAEAYPRPGPVPDWATRMVDDLAPTFGFDQVPGHPWVCRFPAGFVQPDRPHASNRLVNDPLAHYFDREASVHGADCVMLVLAPVSTANVLHSVVRLGKHAGLRFRLPFRAPRERA